MLDQLINDAVKINKTLNSIEHLKDLFSTILKNNGRIIENEATFDRHSVSINMSLNDCSKICDALSINMAKMFPENVFRGKRCL